MFLAIASPCVVFGAWFFVLLYPSIPFTIYASGYDERTFLGITPGMTGEQVEKASGPPLSKVRWGDDGVENWMCSSHGGVTTDFWRRWRLMKDGRVLQVQ